MAKTILTDASVVVNTVDLSDHVESVQITQENEDIDITSMGAVARYHAPGLRNDSITINFFQDFAAAKVDQTLSPLLGVAAGTLVTVKPTSAIVSGSNPKYEGTCVLLGYDPLNGGVGAASMTSVTFRPAQGAQILRGTA